MFWWRRVRLGENGMIVRSKFIPWEQTQRWYWDASTKNVVVIGDVALRVPSEAREAVQALLEVNVRSRATR